ncbi:hypothetical protein QA601_04400 [Chitinispirillales bacterium ANBcel5]|uniref:hypothetical protein n=1 Tax=Cellulosispirillum alkaliphilum TaxID=3039283 RepID=UPI002A567870|nr:hypothetical protein [Chitinispirillales bacterium ANBcel5]
MEKKAKINWWKGKQLPVLTALVVLSCSRTANDQRPDEFPVVSYNNLDVKDFNVKITSAADNREDWVYSPVLVVQKYRRISDARFVSILLKNDRVENPSNSTITVVEEGYLDDAVRGQWFQFFLERENSESAWKVEEIRQANLCGRMGSPEKFSKELCP